VLEAVTVCASNVDIQLKLNKQSALSFTPALENPVRQKGQLARRGGNQKIRTEPSTFRT
jgi:hypothetical protein